MNASLKKKPLLGVEGKGKGGGRRGPQPGRGFPQPYPFGTNMVMDFWGKERRRLGNDAVGGKEIQRYREM